MTNLVASALAEGLKDTITVDLAAVRAAERFRLVTALERQTEIAEASLVAQQRLADAAERQADAFEVVAQLFASCIGTTYASCPDLATPSVNFFRASSDGKPYRCDETEDDGNED
jgi:hypothetical protein